MPAHDALSATLAVRTPRLPAASLACGLFLPLLALADRATAQQGHEHDTPPPASAGAQPTGEEPRDMEASPGLLDSDMSRMAGMTPRLRMPSGRMPGSPSAWSWMTMGLGRLQFNHQGGASGEDELESTNWLMAMGQRPLGDGLVTVMAMLSLEPATVGAAGSPQLFQTGEALDGRPLVDRQHPHDFFMNLSATYRRPVGASGALWAQVAPRGEPALGPTAFMHRASSGDNPASPLGHHWGDSTHITNNVLTIGGGWRGVSLEASAFHGREPDEERWGIEGGGLDSASVRVRMDLPRRLSAQVSYGFLADPEPLEPGDTRRTTASLHYGADGTGPAAASFVWGRNDEEHGVSDAFLMEGAWMASDVDQLFARIESVEKDRSLLLTKGEHHESEDGEAAFATVRSLTLGYLRDVRLFESVRAGVGADLTFYDVPSGLEPAYGDSPVSLLLFTRVRWGRPHGAAHADHARSSHGGHHD
jgi:hypothetical protein